MFLPHLGKSVLCVLSLDSLQVPRLVLFLLRTLIARLVLFLLRTLIARLVSTLFELSFGFFAYNLFVFKKNQDF